MTPVPPSPKSSWKLHTAFTDKNTEIRDLEWRRAAGLAILNGMSQLSGPSNEFFQKIVYTLHRLKKGRGTINERTWEKSIRM
jgi:hypothetical protein